MPDDASAIEQVELQLWEIIREMHKQGIRYEVIRWLMNKVLSELGPIAEVEKWV